MNGQSQYGYAMLNSIEEQDMLSSDAKLVFSCGAKLSKDGDQWCCLLGENLQAGHAVFHKAPIGAISAMNNYIHRGICEG